MTQKPEDTDRVRLLRGYAMETLSAAEQRLVDKRLADSAEWRDDLERERETLRALDGLPSVEAPAWLFAKTMAGVREAADKPKARWLRYGFVATALIALAIVVPASRRVHETSLASSARNNLQRLGIAFKMYAGENKDNYPPLAPYPDVWMFDVRRLYPMYLNDLTVLVEPSLPDAVALRQRMQELEAATPKDWEAITRIAARSYTYPGWVVNSEEDVLALEKGVKRLAKAELENDLTVDGVTLRRPKEGVERFLITDINNPATSNHMQAQIPVLFESKARPHERSVSGANVLYMDGHVELIPRNGKFPVLDSVQRALQSK